MLRVEKVSEAVAYASELTSLVDGKVTVGKTIKESATQTNQSANT
jgi:hypothetical protein